MLTREKTSGDTSWFVRDRLGMFVHLGVYSMAGRHEWVRHNEEIAEGVYDERYFSRFDLDLYDPKLWAKAAADAGKNKLTRPVLKPNVVVPVVELFLK